MTKINEYLISYMWFCVCILACRSGFNFKGTVFDEKILTT